MKHRRQPVAREEDVRLLFEEVGLGHLIVETAAQVVEVLVSEQVNVGAELAFIHFGHLGRNHHDITCLIVPNYLGVQKHHVMMIPGRFHLHATVGYVENFLSKPLNSVWSPRSHTDRQVCQTALDSLDTGGRRLVSPVPSAMWSLQRR